MSSENSRNRADYQTTLPDSNALEAHADSLIEELFADIDDILEDGTRLPNNPDYPTLKPPSVPQVTLPPGTSDKTSNLNIGSLPPADRSAGASGFPSLGYSQTPSPQDRLGAARHEAPTLIPDATPDSSSEDPQLDRVPPFDTPSTTPNPIAEEPIAEDNSLAGERSPISPERKEPATAVDKAILWGTIATFTSLAILFLTWLVSQYRLNVLRAVTVTDSQSAPVTQPEREFIDYMQRSLQAIDQRTTVTIPQSVPQTLPTPSNLPVLTPALPSLPTQSATPQAVPIPVPEPANPSGTR